MDKIAERLKKLRESLELSQGEIAKKLETKQCRISRFEGGEETPRLDTLIKFAKFFNVSLDYLVGRTEDDILYVPVNNGPQLKRYPLIDGTVSALFNIARSKYIVETLSAELKLAEKDPELSKRYRELAKLFKGVIYERIGRDMGMEEE